MESWNCVLHLVHEDVYDGISSAEFGEMGVQSPAEPGMITALPSLFIIAGARLFWLIGRYRPQLQIASCSGLLGIGVMMVGLAPNWKWMVAVLVVRQTGAGMTIPTLMASAQTLLPFQHRGRGMGLWTACFFLGEFASPAGQHRAQFGGPMQAAFLAAEILGLVGAVVGVVLAISRNFLHLTRA